MEILIFVIYKHLLFQILSKFLYELKLKQNLNPLEKPYSDCLKNGYS